MSAAPPYGVVDPAPTRGSEFAPLKRAVQDARLLERRPRSYLARALVTLAGFAACWYLLELIGATWWALFAAPAFAVASTQIAFLGHDCGHQQVSASRTGNTTIGLLAGNLLSGLSIGWWVDKHNRHHANPNKEDHDPDIGESVLAFTTARAAASRGRLASAVVRNQAFLFFPLLLLEGLQLRVASVRYLLSRRTARLRVVEAGLIALHCAAYIGALLLLLTPGQALAFFAVHQAVFGLYMGCSFAPNHKGMPIIGADEKVGYLRRQVLTSRNIRGGWFVDQLLGGLNYQIEHHLFPSMPRANLRHAQRLVREYCVEQRIRYTETSLVGSYAAALRHLHQLGEPLRAAGRTTRRRDRPASRSVMTP